MLFCIYFCFIKFFNFYDVCSFETLLEDNRSLVHQAIHVVTTTHYDHPSFEVDISESYNILSKYKGICYAQFRMHIFTFIAMITKELKS